MKSWKIYRDGRHVFTSFTENGAGHYIERMVKIKGPAVYTVE